MESEFLNYLFENWPILAILAAVCYLAARITRSITKWEDQNSQRHKDSERRHDEVDASLRDIAQRIETIERFLIKKGGANYNDFTKMNSPRKLNDKGTRLFNVSGASKFFEEKKEGLLKLLSFEMNKIRVKSALDVEIYANKVCYDISGNKDFKPIKDFIYTHPIFEGSDISIDTISMLMGLLLRDEYLKIHPEIVPESE